jgi:uncharacterized membrane protein SpoIIM required for sporulation
VRAFRVQVLVASLLLVLGTLTGLALTRDDPDRFYAFVPAGLAQGRNPAASTEELRAALYDERTAAERLGAFAMYLFTHNAQIGMLCFALGVAAGVPVALLLFYNGVMLGALAAVYSERGLAGEFWAWVLPHGVTELLAVAVCGAGGFVLADSFLFPGRAGRWHNLAQRGREAGVLVAGALLMFLLAGLIEGVFRQSVHDVHARTAVAAGTVVAWVLYFAAGSRRAGT